MCQINVRFSIMSFFLLCLMSEVTADPRLFVWTYEYQTMDRGKAEIEQYTTFSTLDLKNRETSTASDLQIELEVGMTNRFDIGLYQSFSQVPSGNLNYSGFKIRARYRLGSKGQYLFDPLLYLEYKGTPGHSKSELEGKIILAREMDNFLFAVNPILEVEFENESLEWQPGYSTGLSYNLQKLWAIGLEMKGSRNGHYLGPVLFHGDETLWMTLGVIKNIGKTIKGKPQLYLRLIVGIGI